MVLTKTTAIFLFPAALWMLWAACGYRVGAFWRAAAIVLCDLASTAYYIGGISEQAVGKAAPWFILAVMLFVYPVTAVYMESCTLFTRGGVY